MISEAKNTNAKSKTMYQNIPVHFEMTIRNHGDLRWMQRLKENNVQWENVFMNNNFGETVLKAFMTGQVKKGKKFLYENQKDMTIAVIDLIDISFNSGPMHLRFDVITIWRADDPSPEWKNFDIHGKPIVKGTGEPCKASQVTNAGRFEISFYNIIPIRFKVSDYDKKGKIQKEAEETLKYVGWSDQNYLRVAAGCVRKLLSEIFYKAIIGELEKGQEFRCKEENGPVYADVRFAGFVPDADMFTFALKRLTFDSYDFDTDDVMDVNNRGDEIIYGIKQGGVDAGDKDFRNYGVMEENKVIKLTEKEIKQRITEAVRKALRIL